MPTNESALLIVLYHNFTGLLRRLDNFESRRRDDPQGAQYIGRAVQSQVYSFRNTIADVLLTMGATMKAKILTAILTFAALCPVWAQPKITVNGDASVNVKPDKIVLTFGIETSDPDIMLAKKKNTDILKKALAAIKEAGVPEKEIQTDSLSIEPRYENSSWAKQNFLGYFVQNTFAVTLTDTSKVDDVVTKVLQSGVNYVHGIDFQTTEFKKYREQARELALQAAREKAGKMAAVLGQTIGAPIQINDNSGGSYSWYYSGWSGRGFGRSQVMGQNSVQNIGGGSPDISDTIALGKISIQASVSVTFELRN